VILARWLASNPRLLILDEPTRGIDVGAKAEIQKLIVGLARKGMSILFISSELEEVVRCCSKVAVMKDRRKIAELRGGEVTQERIIETIAGGAAPVTMSASEGAGRMGETHMPRRGDA